MGESGMTARTRKATKASIAAMVADAGEICGFATVRYLTACVLIDERGDRYMVTITSIKPVGVQP